MPESPLAGVQLHLVQTLDDALEMKRWASERRETPLGIDTESEGLNPVRDRLRLIQLGDKRHGWAVPAIWAGAALEVIDRYDGEFALHNSLFDWRVIFHSTGAKLPWHKVHDTMFLAALVNPLVPKGLKPLSARLVDRNAAAGQRLLDDGMKANHWNWATVPYDYPPYWSYAALDPVLTTHIFEQLYPQVHGVADEAYDLERAVAPLLGGMMDTGLLLDQEYTKSKITELRAYESSVREWLKSSYGISSLMSARQIAAAMETAGLTITAVTPKNGLPSVTKEVLAAISKSESAPEAARELASVILKVRHADKICGTYLESFLELLASDGAIHPSINQLAARTGRMTCNSPNLQNLPRDDKVVRGSFHPRPECAYVSCDFSQVEMRIFASLSEDAGLIEAFRHADETGIDFYAVLATELFGEPVAKKSPRRQNVKSASYARIFGAGLAKMAATAGVSPEQMKPVNDALGQRYPGMNSLPGKIIAQARAMQSRGERPHVRTSTGRYLPCDDDRLFSLVNYLAQGSAAEQLKRAIVSAASAGLADYMLVPVHDEILFEVPLNQVDEIKQVIMESMTDNSTFLVPITCDASVMTDRWVKS
jgi:DNA polymerase I